MTSNQKGFDSLEGFTDEQIAELGESINTLDQEEARIIKEDIEDEERRKLANKPFRRLRKSPLEIINRSLLLIFLASFLSSFISVYSLNRWWFFWYVISAFSCILYSPNRKALKELLDGWQNLEELLKSRGK